MQKQNYLAHYGIAGMKWGHRRGYDSVSKTTIRVGAKIKSIDRALNKPGANKTKLEDKQKKYKAMLERSQKYDKLMNDHAKSISMGRALAEHFFTGGLKSKYSALTAAGYSRGKALTKLYFQPNDMRRPPGTKKRS